MHTLKEEAMKKDESSQPEDTDAHAGVREESGMQKDGTCHPQDAGIDVELRERVDMQEDGTCHPQGADMDVGLKERVGVQEDGTHYPQDADMDVGLRERVGMQEDGTHHSQDADMDVELKERVGMQEDGTCHPQDANMDVELKERVGMQEDGTCHPQDADMDVELEERTGMQEDGTHHPQGADVDLGLRERAGMQEDGTCYPQNANMDVGLREKAGISEVLLGERSPTGVLLASAEQSTEKGECYLNIASEAEAGTEGSSRHGEEQLIPTGKVAAEGSVFLSVEQARDRQKDEDLDRQALLQTQMEKERAVSEAGQELKAEFTDSGGLNSETLEEAAVLKEVGTSEVKEAEREVGSPKTDGDQGEEEALTELEVVGPVEDTGPERKAGSEETVLGGERAATERKDFLEEAPISASTGEVQASPREVFRGNHELCKEDTAREGVIADTESTAEQDLRAVFPGELAAAGGIEKVERLTPPLRETGSEREEETGPEVLKTEDLLGEQKVKGEEEGTAKEVGSEEEDRASRPEMEAHAKDVEPTGATELGEATKLLEDPPKERAITLSEATPQFGKSPKESEATATEHKGGEELPGQESKALWPQGRGLSHDGEGLLGAPGPEADKAQGPEGFFTARCEEWAAKELDSSAGSERLEEDQPLQAQREDIQRMTQGNLSGERLTRAVVVCGEAKAENPQGEGSEDKECPPGTVTGSLTGQNWNMGGNIVEAEEDPHGGGIEEPTAEQKEEESAESKSADGIPEASSAANAQKETWDGAGEALGEAAAEERTGTEDMAPRTEKVAVVEEVTSAGAMVETEQEQAPEAQDREGGETKASRHTGTAGEDTGSTGKDEEHQSGAAEEFRESVSQRETA
jgi:hypothetical protein